MNERQKCKLCKETLDLRKKGATKYGYCNLDCQIYFINKRYDKKGESI